MKHVFISNKYVGDKSVEEIEGSGDVFIFHEKTSPKNKTIKQFFSNSKERALVECYELDQSKKKIILNAFIKKNSLVFEKNVFIGFVGFARHQICNFKQRARWVILLNNKNNIDELVGALVSEQPTNANKFFFKINLEGQNCAFFEFISKFFVRFL